MSEFFTPLGDGEAGEETYQEMRRLTESKMGRAPSKKRIMELWTRRGSTDCVTAVGSPDPICGGIVTAIFDMGPHQPFVVYHHQVRDPAQQAFEVLGCTAYSVSEFSS